MEELRNDLNEAVAKLANQQTMVELTTEMIWGAVVTTTRAFDKVTIRIDPATSRVFISIKLRWWAKWKRAELLRKIWLARAEQRCKPHVPEGWRTLIYYENGVG